MKVMIVIIFGHEKKESEFFYRNGDLSTGGRRESKAISCVLFEM